MNRTLIRVSLLASLVAASLPAAAEIERTALRQINASGIGAQIAFIDSGNPTQGLLFVGIARGLNPNATYVSLVYDDGSVARGANACLPTDTSVSFPQQMVLGVWKVGADGTGTLLGRSTGAKYVALENVGTASIRLDTQPGQPLPSQPDPNRFQLKACGNLD